MLAEILISISLLSQAECQPLFGPGCQQYVPVVAEVQNLTPESIRINKPAIRQQLAAKGIPAIPDYLVQPAYFHAARNSGWRTFGRVMDDWAKWIAVAGALALGGASAGFGALASVEFIQQGSERAAQRAVDPATAMAQVVQVQELALPADSSGTLVVFASAAVVEAVEARAFLVRSQPQPQAGEPVPPILTPENINQSLSLIQMQQDSRVYMNQAEAEALLGAEAVK